MLEIIQESNNSIHWLYQITHQQEWWTPKISETINLMKTYTYTNNNIIEGQDNIEMYYLTGICQVLELQDEYINHLP